MNVFILTGAGVSAESGVPTFRDAEGLWERHRIEEVATPGAYRRDRALVRRFYDERRHALAGVVPNAAHRALARLEAGLRERGGELFLCTQNIDDLHERAGSRAVVHMHGELLKARCTACGAIHPWVGDMGPADACPACHRIDALRPHVVWFGEVSLAMDHIAAALGRADLFAAIGTSGTVAPASAFAARARQAGIPTLEFNLEASSASAFDERRFGPAGKTVPRWVDDVLGEIGRA